MNGLILVAGGKDKDFRRQGKGSARVFKGWSLLDYWQVRLETLKDLFKMSS